MRKLKSNAVRLRMCVLLLFIMISIVSCVRTQVYREWAQVSFVSPDMGKFLTVQNLRARYLESGTLEASMLIANYSTQDIAVRVKFTFVDADGFPVDETNFMPFMLVRGDETNIRQNSLSHQAKDFKVLIDWQ
ncbi:MAG: DUF1425 domain-containing protein [Candidatus Omnitrophota bacterium]